MDQVQARNLEQWLAEHRGAMVQDIIELTNIRSVAVPQEGPHPFGDGCAAALDHMLQYAGRVGLETENNAYYCGSGTLKGKKGDKTIGIFVHLDVVPEGDGWSSDPYDAFLNEDDYIVGRGTSDNKGPVIAALYALRYLKEQGIQADSDIRLVFGCAEEIGMYDMDYYTKKVSMPDFSLVPDCPFPVCCGENGRGQLTFSAPAAQGRLFRFYAGESAGSAAGKAEALLDGISVETASERLASYAGITVEAGPEDRVKVTALGLSKHAATPDGSVDACHLLARALADSGLLSGDALEAVAALAAFSADHYGGGLHMACQDSEGRRLTTACSMVRLEGERLKVTCDVRFPIASPWANLCARAGATLHNYGFQLDEVTTNAGGYHIASDAPVTLRLTEIVNNTLGVSFTPFVMSGGTYARKLPNAVGFGPGRQDIKKPFPAGRGWGHQPDEGVRVQSMLDMVRVYVPALLAVDEMLHNGQM